MASKLLTLTNPAAEESKTQIDPALVTGDILEAGPDGVLEPVKQQASLTTSTADRYIDPDGKTAGTYDGALRSANSTEFVFPLKKSSATGKIRQLAFQMTVRNSHANPITVNPTQFWLGEVNEVGDATVKATKLTEAQGWPRWFAEYVYHHTDELAAKEEWEGNLSTGTVVLAGSTTKVYTVTLGALLLSGLEILPIQTDEISEDFHIVIKTPSKGIFESATTATEANIFLDKIQLRETRQYLPAHIEQRAAVTAPVRHAVYHMEQKKFSAVTLTAAVKTKFDLEFRGKIAAWVMLIFPNGTAADLDDPSVTEAGYVWPVDDGTYEMLASDGSSLMDNKPMSFGRLRQVNVDQHIRSDNWNERTGNASNSRFNAVVFSNSTDLGETLHSGNQVGVMPIAQDMSFEIVPGTGFTSTTYNVTFLAFVLNEVTNNPAAGANGGWTARSKSLPR